MLKARIAELNGELLQVKTENKDAETQLLTKFDNAEKTYSEALDSYDTDMREKNKERDDSRADLEE